jgi:hypothetical protein
MPSALPPCVATVAAGSRPRSSQTISTGRGDVYATALADPRFALQERSSWFRLGNDHWQVLGLDSSYEDGGLYGDQAM